MQSESRSCGVARRPPFRSHLATLSSATLSSKTCTLTVPWPRAAALRAGDEPPLEPEAVGRHSIPRLERRDGDAASARAACAPRRLRHRQVPPALGRRRSHLGLPAPRAFTRRAGVRLIVFVRSPSGPGRNSPPSFSITWVYSMPSRKHQRAGPPMSGLVVNAHLPSFCCCDLRSWLFSLAPVTSQIACVASKPANVPLCWRAASPKSLECLRDASRGSVRAQMLDEFEIGSAGGAIAVAPPVSAANATAAATPTAVIAS